MAPTNSSSPSSEASLLRAIHKTPIIDNHAHPLLKLSAIAKYGLLAIASEAGGAALEDSKTGLAHLRCVNQLAAALGCEPTWPAVEAGIRRQQQGDYAAWTRRCLEGICAVLVDDGLDNPSEAETYRHFDAFTRHRAKRIVRLEVVAAEIINDACAASADPSAAWTTAVERIEAAIGDALDDPEVVGFKSVICYRSGLDVSRRPDADAAIRDFATIHASIKAGTVAKFTRVQHAGLNQFLLHRLAALIRDHPEPHKKPVQFHTGLGDNDITLTKSSPAHLQQYIRAYPEVPIVLLHGSWPFSREAAYLATVYANVYADIGEVFPFLSRDGQEKVVRQVLEICPGSKILWSTDGHWWPETYFVAVTQAREVLRTVLVDYVRKGDYTWAQAVQFVEDIFFHNSNRIYKLGLDFKPLSDDEGVVAPNEKPQQTLSRFLTDKPDLRFLRIYWTDYTASTRLRMMPVRRMWSKLDETGNLSVQITEASLGLLQNDCPVPGVKPTGEMDLHVDLSTLVVGPRKGHFSVMGDFKHKNGKTVALCPRSLLKSTLDRAASLGLEFLLGFEIELVLVRRTGVASDKYEALDGDGHAWSSARALQHEDATAAVEDAVEQLDAAGIYIDMAHPESANGQYEIVLPKAPALEAVDRLIYAREIISNCASARGLRMTLHPKPFAMACGTASHVHMSISTPAGSDRNVYEAFYAGVLKHLRAISAFTYSSMASYERVQDGCWAGGTWVAWGTQNRETPLRRIEGSHWELKSMDGIANPYLALSAVLRAGTRGVEQQEKLVIGDCTDDPALLSSDERDKIHVTERLPRSIGEALGALKQDSELQGLLGRDVVDRFVAVKEAETAMLEAMGSDERRQWVMERY